MGIIIDLQSLQDQIVLIRKSGRSIVLGGGCFDILHVGHIKFLKEAKKTGDCLLVLLESDETVIRLKGKNRPHFSQKDRAEVLSSIEYVDFVILMPPVNKDEDYKELTGKIHPDVIVVTANDPNLSKKKKQAEMVGGKLVVIPFVKTYSSSEIARLLGIE